MGKRRGRSLARRRARLEPRLRLLIVCEGRVTEPRYFRALRHEYRNSLVQIDILPEGGVPKSLVEYALERVAVARREARRNRDPYLNYDEVWCVFDVDNHPNLAEARQQASDNGLKVAISNPCFELWLLLHFRDQRAQQGRHYIQACCREHMPEYEKEIPYGTIQPSYKLAVDRAIALDKWQQEQSRPGGNPSTGVYKLTERIAELGQDNFLRQTRP